MNFKTYEANPYPCATIKRETMNNITRNLKIIRSITGITQKELSDKIGVTQGALSKIESGNSASIDKYSIQIWEYINGWKESRILELEEEIKFIKSI